MDAMMKLAGSDQRPEVAEGKTAREVLAEMQLPVANEQAGEDFSERATMSELMDSTLYMLFPNFAPWAGHGTVISYRHRPNGNDVDSSIMDIYLLTRYPEGSEPPPDAPTR